MSALGRVVSCACNVSKEPISFGGRASNTAMVAGREEPLNSTVVWPASRPGRRLSYLKENTKPPANINPKVMNAAPRLTRERVINLEPNAICGLESFLVIRVAKLLFPRLPSQVSTVIGDFNDCVATKHHRQPLDQNHPAAIFQINALNLALFPTICGSSFFRSKDSLLLADNLCL